MNSRALIPLGLGAGALWLLSRARSSGGSIAGPIPAGRPYVRLVFKAEKTPLSSLAHIADLARDQVQSIYSTDGSPFFTVTASASSASPGAGSLGYAFTTVVARVAGFLEGHPWDEAFDPLRRPFGGIIKGNIALVDVAEVPSGGLDSSRQLELAAGARPLFDVGDWFKQLNTTAQLGLVAVVVVGGYLIYREYHSVAPRAG